MDRWMRVLLFGAGVAMLMLAVGRQRLSPVRFFRPNPIDQEENSLSTKEAKMAHALEFPKTTRADSTGLSAHIGAIANTVAAEQTLALRAADKAALHRRNLAELRAMYVRPLDK